MSSESYTVYIDEFIENTGKRKNSVDWYVYL